MGHAAGWESMAVVEKIAERLFGFGAYLNVTSSFLQKCINWYQRSIYFSIKIYSQKDYRKNKWTNEVSFEDNRSSYHIKVNEKNKLFFDSVLLL